MGFQKNKINLVYCHRMPSRSFFWKGKQFPVCARCTGIHLGYLSFPFFTFDLLYIPLLWSLLMMVPTYLDGLVQAYTKYESNNIWRSISGFVAGIGSMSLVAIIGKAIGNQLVILFN